MSDAFATAVVAVRPAALAAGSPRSRPAVVVRIPVETALRELVLRGLLRRGWSLVGRPGEHEFSDDGPRGRVYLSGDQVRIVANGETVYDGPLNLSAGAAGQAWSELARSAGEVLVFLTGGTQPILTDADLASVAAQGLLVGIEGQLLVAGQRGLVS